MIICLLISLFSVCTDEETATSTVVTLPLANGLQCSVCARLERNTTNTITLHLHPPVLIVNHCPIPIHSGETLEQDNRVQGGEGGGGEGGGGGGGEGGGGGGGGEQEIVSLLEPNAVGIITQNKVYIVCIQYIYSLYTIYMLGA